MNLHVEPLDAQAFAAFGQVIEARDDASRRMINAGTTQRFENLAELVGTGVTFTVAVMRAQPRQLPFQLQVLERHRQASQAFVPWSGGSYLVVVAPGGSRPDIENLRCFRATGMQGVNYLPGTWHHPLLAIGDVSDFLVIDQAGKAGETDCEEFPVADLRLVIAAA